MINVQATVSGEQFIQTCRGLDIGTMEEIAGKFPAVFSGCFVFGPAGDDEGATPAAPPKRSAVYSGPAPQAAKPPRARKPREAKAPSDDIANDAADVLAFLRQNHPISTGEGFQSKNIIPGLDNKRRSAALDLLEHEGKAHHNGKPAGGRRWFLSESTEGDE